MVFSNLQPPKKLICFQTTPGIFSRNLLLKSMRDELLAVHCAGKAADEMQKAPMLSLHIQQYKHFQLPHKSKFVIRLHVKCYLTQTSAKALR